MIRMRGVHKSFGPHKVLRGVDLDVGQGEIVALLGPNGAGKTTALGILTTLVQPDSGTAEIDGLDVVRHPREVQRRISVTGQAAAVDGTLTGIENLRMLAALSGLGRTQARERSDELLARFDLDEARSSRVSTYSGGMRRRLDLALSLVVETPVVFLDEPTTGLDTRSRQQLWNDIEDLASRGTTVLLTTQHLDEADRLAERVLVLDGGVIVADGSPAELKARVGDEVVTVTDAAGTVVAEARVDGSLEGMRRTLDDLAAGGAVGNLSVRTPTLDDVFLALTTSTASPALETR